MKCLQCGSDDIVMGLRAVDRNANGQMEDLVIESYSDPNAWVFKGTQQGTVMANVCAACGFVMLSVSVADAEELKKSVTGG